MRSIVKPGKLDELNCIIHSIRRPVHIIILTETWIKSDSEATSVNLPGYTHYYNFREEIRGGGVSIFVNNCLQHTLVDEQCKNDTHYLWVHINKYSLDLGAVYRSPRTSNSDFIEEYSHQLLKRKRALIFGDFNYDLLVSNNAVNTYRKMISESGYTILNNINPQFCTRHTPTKQSILDHVYTTLKNHKFHLSVVDPPFADHRQLYLEVGRYVPEVRKKIQYQAINYKTLYESVEKSMKSVTNPRYEDVESTIKIAVQANKINKTKIQNPPRSDWINGEIISAIKEKNKKWATYKENLDNDQIRKDFLSFRNDVMQQIQNLKSNYYTKEFKKCQNKPLKMWELINTLANNKIKTHPAPSKINTPLGPITNIKNICDNFNQFFASIGSVLASKITQPQLDTDIPTLPFRSYMKELLTLSATTELEIGKIIDNLDANTSTGLDGISCKTVKCLKNLLVPKLKTCINHSLRYGYFPESLKIAKVCPIHKAGSKADTSNYRPISVLPVLSKVYEKIIYNRLHTYLESINYLSNNQFGFRTKRSTLAATIDLVTNLRSNIDNKQIGLGIFIDLKKAFDTISHSLLLQKLHDIGIRQTAYNILRSYLSNRSQVVQIGETRSNPEILTFGVPQGSILGPLLFLIYINDIDSLNLKGALTLYADDTTLFYFGTRIDNIINQAQNDLNCLYQWFRKNLLTINITKTNYIIFSSKNKIIDNHPPLYINNETLMRVHSEKYLGLHIDNRLSWDLHINKLCSKISNLIARLRGTIRCLPKSVRYLIYNSMVKPHLEYLIEIWGTSAKTNLKQLQIKQNKIIKLLFHYNYLSPTEKVFKETGLMTVSQIYKYNTCILVQKILNKNINTKLSFTKVGQAQKRITKRMNNITLIRPRTNYGKKSILYEGARLYNELPNNIKDIQSFTLYKKVLKHHILKDFIRP